MHYRFHVRYCNPESGWEKGNVENKVGTVRRNLFVPMPQYTDMVLYNKQLLRAAEVSFRRNIIKAPPDQRTFAEG